MNATLLTAFPFSKSNATAFGMTAHLGKASREEAIENAAILAASIPYHALHIERMYDLQTFDRNLPQFMVGAQLRVMNITTTPLGVYQPNGELLGILSKDGAFYVAADSQEIWDSQYRIDLSAADDVKRKRAAYYLLRTGLPVPGGLSLPQLSPEELEQLDKKCPDELLFPQLCQGGSWMPIFNNEATITVSRHPKRETNGSIWYDNVNMGVLLPMSQPFVDKLNAGQITGFEAQVREVPDSSLLEVEVRFSLDGEQIVHTVCRPMVNFSSGATLCVPFGDYSTAVHSSSGLRLEPCLRCESFAQDADEWNVTWVQGGVRFVRVLVDGRDQGMLRLPRFPRSQYGSDTVIVSADIGESSFALSTKAGSEHPRSVVFDSSKDILPLVYSSERNRAAICNASWFPKLFQGTARSIAQFFRGPDGLLHPDPSPFSVGRSHTDDSISSITLARTLENGLSSGFKGDMIRSRSDETKAYAYQGYLAATIMLGIHQALKYGSDCVLRLSYPNNPQFKKLFQSQINRALQLIHQTLIDEHGDGFRFQDVQYRTEAFCCTVSIEKLGLNDRIGASFRNYISADGGGSTTDLAVRTCDGSKFQLFSVPLAGKTVTLSSLVQVARCLESGSKCGLSRILRNVPPALESLMEQQLAQPVLNRLSAASSKTDAMVQLSSDEGLLETCQTIIDHFPLDPGPNGQLLRSLICLKDLLLMDLALAQCAPVFSDRHLDQSKLHLLRLGNGSKSVNLISDPKDRFQNGRQEMDSILALRANRYLGENARLLVEYNSRPKTEVVNGLSAYTEADEKEIRNFVYTDPAADLQELEEKYLPLAIERVREQASWLRESIPAVTGSIHPYYSGLENGMDQLLSQFEDPDDARAVLIDTLSHERGRFGNLHLTSAKLGVDIWCMCAILDSADRQLAIAQIAWMEQRGVLK